MSIITISWHAGTQQAVEKHALACHPHECCGILVGTTAQHAQNLRIMQIVESTNLAETDRRRDRYVLDPLTLVKTDHRARSEGLEIVGFYHSHPNHPAIPSHTDAELAWTGYVYVIVSVTRDAAGEMRAWHWPREGEPPMACRILEGD
jgi:proteasome lid subunit RPN8/RPN11